ncbi:MAG: AI-2E family transporter [Chitinophagaceae bacterium]|nr:AI-2E family transporter [Rubrivivax sp.]
MAPAPPRVQARALVWLLVGVTLALGWILLPFYGTIMWSAIIALLFAPVNRWWLRRLNGRRTAAALLTLLLVMLVVVVPFALVTASLAREAAALYQRVEAGELNFEVYFGRLFATLPQWINSLLERAGLDDFGALQRRLAIALTEASQLIARQTLAIGQNTLDVVASLFIGAYLAFFLIRDGDQLARDVRHALPLAPEHRRELAGKFATVIRATVKGNLVVAALQGLLGGVAFWFLGVGGAMLWAVLMAFLSLLPAVGAALVWGPVAVYFLMSGEVGKGLGLLAWGVLVVGLVDNLLRPLLVGKDTRMPDYVVLISTLGGMAVFGLNGFVIGPAIAAMFIAVWHIHGTQIHGTQNYGTQNHGADLPPPRR